MNTDIISQDITLNPVNNQRLANLCGQFNEHLRQIEQRFGVEINQRGHHFKVIGAFQSVLEVVELLKKLYDATLQETLNRELIHLFSQPASLVTHFSHNESSHQDEISVKTKRGFIKGRGSNQTRYIQNILSHDINFGIGPAGTGKTYLAVACAVEALEKESVRRLVLVRPAVEAGEKLGFLPGDLVQKVDPYLRPLYDALFEMLGFDRVTKLLERNIIEVAPLAYMRGRTLNESFIILDEAQNTTIDQMKMFLTRIGFGSTAVITGDVTQVDLPRERKSGLRHVIDVLHEVEGISFSFLTSQDVVRHPLVAKIIDAYERVEKKRDL
ncbi:MAG: hypothetical protein RIT27_442 [Pseudomonadota bacterium]